MIHQYKNNGYNIVMDVNSGSVHSVDEVVYDVVEMFSNIIAADTEKKLKAADFDAYKAGIKAELVKKYSDYIRHPIKMNFVTKEPVEGKENEYKDVTELRTLNSMVPLWKKNKSDIIPIVEWYGYIKAPSLINTCFLRSLQ